MLTVEHGDGVRVRHWLVVRLDRALALEQPEGETERVAEAQ